jgi:phosphatidylserine synthase
MHDYIKSFFGWPNSKYSELSAYLTSLTCVIIFCTHPDLRQYLSNIFDNSKEGGQIYALFIAGFIAILGFVLSIFHVFTNRQKTQVEKYLMGAFTIGATAIAGIEAAIDELNSGGSFLVLFPIWNILMGIIMLYQIRYGKFEVTDENATILEVSVGSILLFIVFAITYFTFHLSWAMAFSICMLYSTSLMFILAWIIKCRNLQT